VIDSGALIWGLLLGLIVGGLAALFKAPISGKAFREQVSESVNTTGQNLRSAVEAAVPADPVAESLAQGKAAARRRRAELGLTAGQGSE
jgi:gas vesicle protein